MESPKRKRISYVKAWVLIVDHVKPGILKGTAVRLDLSKNERIKRAAIFWNDFNDHLILYASFLDRCDFCRNRTHDAGLRGANALPLNGTHSEKKGTGTASRFSASLRLE